MPTTKICDLSEMTGPPMRPFPLCGSHWSVDQQAISALRFIETVDPGAHQAIIDEFPWAANPVFDDHFSWFDTEAMNLDAEAESWLLDAIEDSGLVFWEDGEPWGWEECTEEEAEEAQDAQEDWWNQ